MKSTSYGLFLKVAWLVAVFGLIGICYWYHYEILRLPHVSLIADDEVLFGPIPVLLSGFWLVLFIFLLFSSIHFYFVGRDQSGKV